MWAHGKSQKEIWDESIKQGYTGVYPHERAVNANKPPRPAEIEALIGKGSPIVDWKTEIPPTDVRRGKYRSVRPREKGKPHKLSDYYISPKDNYSYPNIATDMEVRTLGPGRFPEGFSAEYKKGRYKNKTRQMLNLDENLTGSDIAKKTLGQDAILPVFEHANQLAIAEAERFAPGTYRGDPNFNANAGNSEARNAANRLTTTLLMREAGKTDDEIVKYLNEHPPFETMDVPLNEQVTPNRIQLHKQYSDEIGFKDPGWSQPMDIAYGQRSKEEIQRAAAREALHEIAVYQRAAKKREKTDFDEVEGWGMSDAFKKMLDSQK